MLKNQGSVKETVRVSRTVNNNYAQPPTITVSFIISGTPIQPPVLVDSGVNACFMDSTLARMLGLTSTPLPDQLRATSLDGSFLWEVSHQTSPITMLTGDSHVEEITSFEYSSPSHSWLRLHNPHIDWVSRGIAFNPSTCHSCVYERSSSETTVGNHDLREVFSKTKATSLPCHQPHHCTFDLLTGSSPP